MAEHPSLLLDTHALYWSLFDPAQLVPAARQALENPYGRIHVSVASLWEFAIKSSLGKLRIPEDFFVRFRPASVNVALLPIEAPHLETYRALPLLHRDPFDRILVAQALAEGLTLLTRDPDIRRYAVPCAEA